jgi:hypothetical protein
MAYGFGFGKEQPMNEYLCCDPSIDQEERVKILALTARQAAEEFAETTYDEKYGSYIPVWVYDSLGNETRWYVERELRPVFTAEPAV